MNKRIKKKIDKLCTSCMFEGLCKVADLSHCEGRHYYEEKLDKKSR